MEELHNLGLKVRHTDFVAHTVAAGHTDVDAGHTDVGAGHNAVAEAVETAVDSTHR